VIRGIVSGSVRLRGLVIGLAALATLGLGLFWSPLSDFAERATVYFAGG